MYYLCSPSGKGFLSGHADGAIVRYFFDDEGSGDSQVNQLTYQHLYQIPITCKLIIKLSMNKDLNDFFSMVFFQPFCVLIKSLTRVFDKKTYARLDMWWCQFDFRARSAHTHVLRMHWPFLRTLLWLLDATRGSSRMDVKAEAFSILITVVRKMNMNLPVLSPVQVASPLS